MSLNQTPTSLEQFFQVLIQANGVVLPALPKRPILNILGGTVVDDPINNRTNITVGSGGLPAPGTAGNVLTSDGSSWTSAAPTGGGGTVPTGGTGVVTIPAHAVVLGEGTSPIGTAGPGAVGLPLVGAGVGADPAFAALTVPGGGTGAVTLPAHAALVGAGVGPVVGVAPGTSGNVLTSNGTDWTSAAPTGGTALVVQNNGGAITQRAALDLLGMTYADDAIGNRMRFTAPSGGSSWFASERAVGRFWVTDPIYGAVGDDSHDDTAAIQAAHAAAKLVLGTIMFPQPSVAYKVTSETLMDFPGHWQGFGNNVDQCLIRAHGTMRSILAIRSTLGMPLDGSDGFGRPRATVDGITFDANGQTFQNTGTQGLLHIGAEFTNYHRTSVIKALGAGIRTSNTVLAVTLSGVTHTGTGPAGVTVSQADPNYYGLSQVAPTPNLMVKIVGGGALGTATYQLSLDNGVTYQTSIQTVRAAVNLVKGNSLLVYQLSGLQMQFPAGTYVVNDTYAFTNTLNTADFATTYAGNASISYLEVSTHNCGSTYATADQIAKYSGNVHTVGGTVATTAGSQNIVGTGTSFMSMVGAGSSRIAINLQPGDRTYMGFVVDDKLIQVIPGTEPSATASGLTYGISTYGGYYEDGLLDGPASTWVGGVHGSNSICFQFVGRIGPSMTRPILTSCAVAGMMFGAGTGDNTGGTVISSPEMDSGVHCCYLFSPSSGGLISEPTSSPTFDGTALGWILTSSGVVTPFTQFGAASYLSNKVLQLAANVQTLTSAGQTLVIPDLSGAHVSTGHTSYINVNSSTSFVLTGLLFADPKTEGVIIVLHNVGVPQTLQNHVDTGTTGLVLEDKYVLLGSNETMAFISDQPGSVAPWRQLWGPVRAYVGFGGGNSAGNLGQGGNRIQTVSSAAATEIYHVNVVNSLVSPGTVIKFDITAQSQNGANWAAWLDCCVGWSCPGGVTGGLVIGVAMGSGAGNVPPLGWAISLDPSGTTPFPKLYVAGDVSANTVTWVITVNRRDPGR